MPTYVYMCPNGNTETMTLPMFYDEPVICAGCGLEMWRKPQAVTVTWGGLKPSEDDHPEWLKDHIRDAPRNRDEYWKKKEQMNE